MESIEYQNLKLILSWNGEKFSGYQYQPHAFTVQEAITNAWHILTKETVKLQGCSRLDAGVHAQHYVLNLHTMTKLSVERIIKGLNGILHSNLALDISVYQGCFTNSDFHARFHSKGKHYRYLIWYGFSEHTFLTKRCWHVRAKLSLEDIQEALNQFIGNHDFAAFRSSDCSAKTTVRNIYQIDSWIHPLYPEMLVVDIWGDGFLKNMIRNIVGTGVDMATGKLHKNTITEAFQLKDRNKTGMCAPAWALTLMHVFYEKNEMEMAIKKSGRYLVPC
ncbi:tRNA pseudouridine(38-40) synthase TruA [Silvanigrella aquatica]|uniref:tRNA pseudouridine synthase A n=1 Tax=Silvanigrella aquatica TaxID=1915309 RepID=A0A1L4D076_9BACT|nr:tRNA pseudouridine(38-40) synthase TruA [Silvanigrella aquatica]APJ03587.1 tRNA pseudouridine(38-40) synthase TruA [Silvanigrella aquatica]